MSSAWTNTLLELNELGNSKSHRNRVFWGSAIGTLLMCSKVFYHLIPQFTKVIPYLSLTILTLWSLTIYNWIPTYTLFLKFLKHSTSGIVPNFGYRESLMQLSENVYLVSGSLVLTLGCFVCLNYVTITSRCLTNMACVNDQIPLLSLQELTNKVCVGESRICFIWLINIIMWGLICLFTHLFNKFIVERLWRVERLPDQSSQNQGNDSSDGNTGINSEAAESREPRELPLYQSIDPESPNFVQNWQCDNPDCPNHSVDGLNRLKLHMISPDWFCINPECDQSVRAKGQIQGRQQSLEGFHDLINQCIEIHIQRMGRNIGSILCNKCKDRIRQTLYNPTVTEHKKSDGC